MSIVGYELAWTGLKSRYCGGYCSPLVTYFFPTGPHSHLDHLASWQMSSPPWGLEILPWTTDYKPIGPPQRFFHMGTAHSTPIANMTNAHWPHGSPLPTPPPPTCGPPGKLANVPLTLGPRKIPWTTDYRPVGHPKVFFHMGTVGSTRYCSHSTLHRAPN